MPLDDADALVGPSHEGALRVAAGDVLGVVEDWEDFVAEPFGDVAVFGVPEAVEGFVGAGFADDLYFLVETAEVFQDDGVFLFWVHALGQAVGAAGVDQTGEVAGLAVDQDCAQLVGVALEGDRSVGVLHGEAPSTRLRSRHTLSLFKGWRTAQG